jgi:hypothetical protein
MTSKEKVLELIDVIPEKVIDFCELKFDSKERPEINLIFDRRYKTRLGEYRVGIIVLFPYNIPSVKNLVKTIIHEYVHHLQLNHHKKMENYYSLLEEFGYENHPQEIEASDITKYYYKECIEYLKFFGYLK